MNTNYVISIVTAAQRREHIEKEFNSKNIPFEFFDAMTPSAQLTETINQLLPELLSHPNQTLGEKACLMSHLTLWERCIDENMPFITIFEDDVVLSKNAHLFLNNSDWITERFSNEAFIIKIETVLQLVNTKSSNVPPLSHYSFPKLISDHTGCGGYIISQKAAKLLLIEFNKLTNEQLRPIDILIFDTFLKYPLVSIYQLEPAICIQLCVKYPQESDEKEELQSQLFSERKQNRKINPYKRKLSLWQLLIKGLTKPYRLYKKKQRKVIPFE
ncbi:glycosyltransferase family 25 protein [Pasteurella oralis]|uniref:Glycosyltransferase family 25 protein n=1 Tax=Pasteurella oralis TaxID=1071947 RepID=A0ABW4NVQ5_9PAST|nr:glycosyltransferase family 25 protein [Pasteurella oralis]